MTLTLHSFFSKAVAKSCFRCAWLMSPKHDDFQRIRVVKNRKWIRWWCSSFSPLQTLVRLLVMVMGKCGSQKLSSESIWIMFFLTSQLVSRSSKARSDWLTYYNSERAHAYLITERRLNRKKACKKVEHKEQKNTGDKPFSKGTFRVCLKRAITTVECPEIPTSPFSAISSSAPSEKRVKVRYYVSTRQSNFLLWPLRWIPTL